MEAGQDRRKQRALAFAMMLKQRLGDKSFIKNYSINKLRKFIGCSPTTAKKYVAILIEMGIITFGGKDGKVMVMRRLYSGTKHRNVRCDGLCFKTFKDAYRSLQSLIFMLRQAAKDFVKRLIRVSNDPKPGEDLKRARKLCKKYAWQNPATAKYEYREFGLSYAKIAKEVGCCVATAQKVVKYAVVKHWVKKHVHAWFQTYLPRVFYCPVDGYMFTTRNNGYNVPANTYALSSAWERRLVAAGMAFF